MTHFSWEPRNFIETRFKGELRPRGQTINNENSNSTLRRDTIKYSVGSLDPVVSREVHDRLTSQRTLRRCCVVGNYHCDDKVTLTTESQVTARGHKVSTDRVKSREVRRRE